MAYAVVTVKRDAVATVRATLQGIGLTVLPGIVYREETAVIGCQVTIEQFDWLLMCPGVIEVEGL